MKPMLASLFFAVTVTVGAAQTHEHPQSRTPDRAHSPSTPYAGLQDREIKALSAQQVDELHSGKGMSLALAAELNGYPGPAHVLELQDALQLTRDQQKETANLVQQMKLDAQRLGQGVLAAEAQLDRLFKNGQPSATTVSQAVEAAARAHAALRASHLGFHLRMVEVLTPAQTAAYQRLRGYAAVASAPGRP